MKKYTKVVWIIIGIVFLILGTIGIVLPVMPTIPFYLVTLICFSKGSKRLHSWFTSTKVYEKHLKSFVDKEGMTLETKLYFSWIAFSCLAVAFYFSRKILVLQIIIVIMWLIQLYYFIFKIKTIK